MTDRVPWQADAYLDLARRACFVCELLDGNPDYPHHIAYRDADAVVFASRFPSVLGHFLIAPIKHREHAIGDFTADEYLAIQRVVHLAGSALSGLLTVERLYVLSLGSQQANRHVHWHLAPLPPGVPYEQQQTAVFDPARGHLDVPDDELADLARRLGERMADSSSM
ncbi:HIT family protein [Amycolatopsis sp. CB00013]|uniref:HIT family protein n=1 Tax=Amycolatopsis sp. CB00013 TaxID=1703945 RepID=UPI00093C00BD|nr:HIT domain-containing protein [Amycolatopsis sp. CB00013]OKK01732.1 HIT family hydrolase [Amycolatopsis sp. CB00013]